MGWFSSLANHTSRYMSPWSRTKVDMAQTSFWEGREFRTYLRSVVEPGTPIVVRATVPGNIVLLDLSLGAESGHVVLSTRVGGTPGGTFASALPVFATNTMAAVGKGDENRRADFGVGGAFGYYVPTVQLHMGGTHSGGTELDVLAVKISGNSNFASSVGISSGSERGVGPNTYYFVLTALETSLITFKARWEERL